MLRRNPKYKGDRPRKLDTIIVREGVPPDRAGQLVVQGQADYAAEPDLPPAPAFAPGGRYEKEFGRAGRRLVYVRPASSASALLLFNTRRGILRDASLRRAVNFALDRRSLAAAVGGTPRSSLIPPGVPGYRSTQPYPPTGNLARARALARGKQGTALIGFQAGDPTAGQLGDAIGAALARIGITLKGKPFADPVAAANDPKQKIDLLGIGWAPDYVDPFDVVNVLLQPEAHAPGYPAFFVERTWIERMRHVAATPEHERANAYARLDSELARNPAPFAVLFGVPGVPQLFSNKIGCRSFLPAFDGWVDFSALCLR